MACNNALIRVEHERGTVNRGTELTAVVTYLGNCPDCVRPQVPLS
jgi:hypothetical protein